MKILSDKITDVLLLLILCVSKSSSLKMRRCGTRIAASPDFQFPESDMELTCYCEDDRGVIYKTVSWMLDQLLSGSFGFERFSDIFNPYIRAFADKGRGQRISLIVLRDCRDVKIDLDLENLTNRDAHRITDVSFQNMASLGLRMRSASERALTIKFDEIKNTEVSGNLNQRDLVLKMFFRDRRSQRPQGSVTFTNLELEPTLSLLNLMNLADFTVDNSYFRRVDEVDFRGVTRCHNTRDAGSFYRPEVECSKENLFSSEYIR